MNDFAAYQIHNLVLLLQSPGGIIGLLALLALGVAAAVSNNAKWLVVMTVMYFSTFGYFALIGGELAAPLSYFRLYGRTVCGVGLIMLLIPALFADRGWRTRTLLGGTIALFVYQLVIALRAGFGGDPTRCFLAALTYGLMFASLLVGVSRWLQTPEDAIRAIWAIALAGVCFVGGTIYQYLIDPSKITWAGRLLGTSGNANHAGTALATGLIPLCFLMSRPGPKWRRIGLAVATGLLVVMLLWTGSRTATAVCLVGIGLLFRFRFLTLIGAALAVGIFVIFMLKIFTDAGDMAGRMISLDNTRAGVWAAMFQEFLQHPVFGIDSGDSVASENSYLLVLSRTGIVGAIPFVVGAIMIMRSVVELQRARRWLGEHKMLADMAIAGLISLAVGGMFEGYLYATYSMPLFAIFIYFAMITFLLDYAQVQSEMGVVDEPAQEYAPLEFSGLHQAG